MKIQVITGKTRILHILLSILSGIALPAIAVAQSSCDTLSIQKFLETSEQKREQGELQAADSIARMALKCGDSYGNLKWKALAYCELAVVQYVLRDYDEALNLLSRSQQINNNLGNEKIQANILTYRAAININQQKTDDLEKDLITSRQIFEKYGDQKGIVRVESFLGILNRNKGNPDKALQYHESSLTLAEKIGYSFGIANNHGLIGTIYAMHGQFPEARSHFESALKEWQKIDNKSGIADSYHVLGMVDFYFSNYAEALTLLLQALEIRNQIGDSLKIGESYHDIGHVYYKQGKPKEALKNYLTALRLFESAGIKERIAKAHSSLGNAYAELKDFPNAIQQYELSITLQKEIQDKAGLIFSYNNLAGLYIELNQNKKAEEYTKDAKSLALELGDLPNQAQASLQLSKLLLATKETSEAKQQAEDAIRISRIIGSKDYLHQSYLLLSQIEDSLGHFRESLTAYKNYKLYEDSIRLAEKEKITDELTMKYETERKDHELELQRIKIKKQMMLRNYMIAGFVLFGLLAFVAYHYFITRQKLKLQTLRNKIAIDLHDDVGSTLSSIAMFSEMAQQQSKEVIPLLDTIGENSRKMLDAMADIVWTINPENDQFENIILRMRSYAYEILGAKQIGFDFTADDDIARIKLPMDVRKNLFLIFKEATNNIVKYANADTALFSIKNENDQISMIIQDNGKGFDVRQSTEGNGLKNMKKRAAEIGAKLWIESFPGKGTTIQFQISI